MTEVSDRHDSPSRSIQPEHSARRLIDNKTLRATLLIGGHGYGVIQLFAAVKETAGTYVSLGYASMALGPALGLLFAWFALTQIGHEQSAVSPRGPSSEAWLAASTWFMFITIHGMIFSVALFWTVTPH
jgi:hypothetical protein